MGLDCSPYIIYLPMNMSVSVGLRQKKSSNGLGSMLGSAHLSLKHSIGLGVYFSNPLTDFTKGKYC